MSYNSQRYASKLSYESARETCPAVDEKFGDLERALDNYREKEQESRMFLRDKLTEKCAEVIELQERVDELEKTVENLESSVGDMKSEIKNLEKQLSMVEQ